MTWRYRLAAWLLKPTPEWCVARTEDMARYVSIVVAQRDLLTLIEQHPHLAPTTVLLPIASKTETRH